MRKFCLAILALAAASTAHAAVVTFTFSPHEGASGLTTATNAFAIYATVSQGDNSGLFSYSLDLTGTGDPGGPTTLTLANRTPTGIWDIDDTSANYDGGVYYTKFGGFGSGRGASGFTGVVSGVQDLAKDTDLVRIYGVGQVAHRMDDFRPPDATGTLGPIPYKPYAGLAQTDGGGIGGQNAYGNPAMPSSTILPGSVRIATGTWTGTMPSIQTASVNTKACVWKLNTTTDQTEAPTIQFAFRDLAVPEGAGQLAASMTSEPIQIAAGGVCSVPEPIFGTLLLAVAMFLAPRRR
jgi:hypothetical protein